MLGFVSKNKLLREMKRLKESGRKENNAVRYPPQNEMQERMNMVLQGYEEGHDNFYNGLYDCLIGKQQPINS